MLDLVMAVLLVGWWRSMAVQRFARCFFGKMPIAQD
jgi:hypothetical protein